jgi:hypothetical protein
MLNQVSTLAWNWWLKNTAVVTKNPQMHGKYVELRILNFPHTTYLQTPLFNAQLSMHDVQSTKVPKLEYFNL